MRRRLLVAVLAAGLVLGGCGDDDPQEEAGDEASFCRLAAQNDPVAEAPAVVLIRLEELAPEGVDASVRVLLDLAERLAELEADDPETLALEFEVRFSENYIAARDAVELYIAGECPTETSTTTGATSETTTDGAGPSTTTSTSSVTASSAVEGDGTGDEDDG